MKISCTSDRNREPEQVAGIGPMPVADQERRGGSSSPRKKCTMFASTLTIGSTSAGNRTFLIRLPPAISEPDASVSDEAEPVPRQDAAEHEQRVRLQPFGVVRQDDREDEGVDEEQQQRVDERPEEAEHRAAVARLELTHDQALDQPAIPKQVGEVGEQSVSRVRNPPRTEAGDAPGRQGARSENTGSIRVTSNAAGRDAAPAECRGISCAGH